MSKMNCQCCNKPIESRSMLHCRACDSLVCPKCYDMGNGYCDQCYQSMDIYE